jgi:ankyrin repeat protein
VKLLVKNGADLEASDEQGQTALMKAAARGEAAVVSALLESGAAVNARDNEGATALLHSLSREYYGYYGEEAKTLPQRRLEVAQVILLTKNVDLNSQNANGETALMRALRLENVAMIKSLLVKGADPNRSDRFGDTAWILAYAVENGEIETLFAPVSLKRQPLNVLNAFLRAAIARKDEAKVKELLARGADPNYEYAIDYSHPTIKRTMLILAASVGHAGIVQMLLDKGANVNAKGLLNGSESGLTYGTALDAAQNPEVVVLLKKAGQD